ncbi:hypothetical protein ACFSX9_07815 [Flavobacterium ardleyense]|uniref:Outer membrane protein beta-barrel domain-containing protein n=1 Tax=Flavobacterium ardleyense TaxID=2038737 RepID=A0ABW5Z8K3_9FLAO
MREQKNIERLFQEKFKDFEALPPHDAWENIASRLNEKKKKKRVSPFWLQASGIAASLVIIGTLIWNYQFENNSATPTNSVVVSGDSSNGINANDSQTANEAVTNIDQSEGSANGGAKVDLQENSKQDKINTVIDSKNNVVIQSNEAVSNNDKSKKSQNDASKIDFEKRSKQDKISTIINSNNNVVIQSKENKDGDKELEKAENLNRNHIPYSKENIVSTTEGNTVKSTRIPSKDILVQKEVANSATKNLVNNQKEIVKTYKEKNTSSKSEIIFGKENEPTKYTNTEKTNLKETNRSKSIVRTNKISDKDSTLVAEIAKELNPLEEMLLAKEEGKNEEEKEKRNKWAVSTNASPVYFNSLAQGSSLDQQFESNTKNFSTTLSYGVSGSYALNKKVSVRAGVNNINLSYNTNDVLYQTKLSAIVDNNTPTISRNSNATNVSFTSEKNTISTLSGDVENISQRNIGALKQEIGYVEVPLELTCKLIDKKFGIEVIGGMSTLFLNVNTVSLVTDGMQMEVGKANNLNDIHFSSNVGLGFKYNFWGNFNANFQPMFKYQINTFSGDSGNFKPYFIGLYSGISFSF